eukprot:CAMPEP_0198126090 /NCGR_PEP_ID=MMETSP1442-20131203/44014_1 /TAXON_ID= /ORGANISM="Craspedostauros australis, Strain CCMP3328" /LENGTH=53 /DNA_ID=CAMNT_0043785807 /DNA_START=58 /DNA_END=216 /DNA_ORIENTATION=-
MDVHINYAPVAMALEYACVLRYSYADTPTGTSSIAMGQVSQHGCTSRFCGSKS